jgi:hypothetical protein
MPGRPRKPTALLLLTGAGNKNPGRLKDRVVESAGPSVPIGNPPVDFMIQSPESGYRQAERLRAIWEECLAMWPWADFSDRFTVEAICRLKVKERNETIKTGERTTLAREIRTIVESRWKAGQQASGASGANRSDPRAAYAEKYGIR